MLAARFRSSSGALVVWALVVVVVGVGVGACGDSDSSDATPTARVPRSTTTTSDAPPTTAAPGEEDFTAILRDLLARRDEAYEKNDVTILESIYQPTCPCLAAATNVIERRRAEGVHTEGERQQLHSVAVLGRPEPDWVLLRAVTEQGPNNLVRGDGSVARPGETEPPTAYLMSLELSDGQWRIADIQRQSNGPAA